MKSCDFCFLLQPQFKVFLGPFQTLLGYADFQSLLMLKTNCFVFLGYSGEVMSFLSVEHFLETFHKSSHLGQYCFI